MENLARREEKLLNKTEFAYKTDRLLGGKSRLTLALAAVVTLLAVGAAGVFLAYHADRMRDDIMRSNFVESLTTQAERSDVAQLFADPDNSRLLMKYIDSMAGAVENMELSPSWRLSGFMGILSAAKTSGVKIDDFECPPDGKLLIAECELSEQAEAGLSREARAAAATSEAEKFVSELRGSGAFVTVELGDPPDSGKKFKVNCSFT